MNAFRVSVQLYSLSECKGVKLDGICMSGKYGWQGSDYLVCCRNKVAQSVLIGCKARSMSAKKPGKQVLGQDVHLMYTKGGKHVMPTLSGAPSNPSCQTYSALCAAAYVLRPS